MLFPPAAAEAPVHAAAASSIVHEINEQRIARGLPIVTPSSRLARLAERHSRRILLADRLSHFLGGSVRQRVPGRWVGEALAWAPRDSHATAPVVVRAWMSSPSHRAVLLDRRIHRVGIGRRWGTLGRSAGFAITADFAS